MSFVGREGNLENAWSESDIVRRSGMATRAVWQHFVELCAHFGGLLIQPGCVYRALAVLDTDCKMKPIVGNLVRGQCACGPSGLGPAGFGLRVLVADSRTPLKQIHSGQLHDFEDPCHSRRILF